MVHEEGCCNAGSASDSAAPCSLSKATQLSGQPTVASPAQSTSACRPHCYLSVCPAIRLSVLFSPVHFCYCYRLSYNGEKVTQSSSVNSPGALPPSLSISLFTSLLSLSLPSVSLPSEYDRQLAPTKGSMASAYLDPNLNHHAGLGGGVSKPGTMDRVLKIHHYLESNSEPSTWASHIRHGDATDVRVS